MTDKFKVTVEEPVTREVTVEDVRRYLRAYWSAAGARDILASLGCGLGDDAQGQTILRAAVRHIATREDRQPAEVLREIAGDEPITTGFSRAQLASAVDEAHAALHKVADMMPDEIGSEWEQRLSDHLEAAHDALHRVGAGLPRVGCATPDPEAQRLAGDFVQMLKQPLPCEHTVGDLIVMGTPPVTTCGACLAAPQAMAANEFKMAARRRAVVIVATLEERGIEATFLDAYRNAMDAHEQADGVEAAAWTVVAGRVLRERWAHQVAANGGL